MPENIAGAAVQDHRAIAVHLVESAGRAAVNRHQIGRGRFTAFLFPSLRGQGHQLHRTCLVRRGRNHAMADNHGREGTAHC